MAKTNTKPGYLLALTSTPALAITPPGKSGGIPTRRFRKELIRSGQFVKQSEGIAFEVDQRLLEHWAATFSQMHSRGIKVPVPSGHDKAGDADANNGWVHEMFVEGDRLVGVLELIGDDALKLAGTSDVSIFTKPEYADSFDNQYKWPILHVALCTDPVIPGLGEFVPIAASKGETPANVPVLTLQETLTMPDLDPNAAAAAGAGDPIKEAFKTKIMEAVDDDSLDMKATLSRIKEILQAQEKAMGLLSDKPKPAEPAPDQLEPGIVAASRGKAPDPTVLGLKRDNLRMKMDALAAAGKLPAKMREKLEAEFIGPNDEKLALSLSNGGTSGLDSMLAVLEENTTIQLGEQTGGQVLALSNPNAAKPLDEKTKKYMAEQAGVKT
jgi:hypothetical protein